MSRRSRQYTAPAVIDDSGARLLEQVPLTDRTIREGELQTLIFEHPDLLPISEIEPICANQVALAREIRTRSGPLDILLINEDGFLTLVETKLWRNPEARRAVVGQIIDYAKDIAQWSFEDLDAAVRRASSERKGLIEIIRDDAGDFDETHFVRNVERNLRLGRFLLLIVGDGVHEGIEQMASFLNQTPQLGFRLALVEMSMFFLHGSGEKPYLVQPRVVAQTREVTRAVVEIRTPVAREAIEVTVPTAAKQAASSGRTSWTWDSFLEHLGEEHGSSLVEFASWCATLSSNTQNWKSIGGVGVH